MTTRQREREGGDAYQDELLHRVEDVAVDDGSLCETFLLRESVLVDDLHLLGERALARLAGSEEEQLDLGVVPLLLGLELRVYLL
jgi:hypothetical protein